MNNINLALATMGIMSHPVFCSFDSATNAILTTQNSTGGEVIIGQPETFQLQGLERGIVIDDFEPIRLTAQPKLATVNYYEPKKRKPNKGLQIGSYRSKSKNKFK